ncbi:MAG TPA: hypothetical protein VEJ19_00155 [Nitrososphaerales archaeon]|nr:hypothetical protein [Nitrososphaerales archaeon]
MAKRHIAVIFLVLLFLLAFTASSLLVLVWHDNFNQSLVIFLAISGSSLVSAFFLLILGPRT